MSKFLVLGVVSLTLGLLLGQWYISGAAQEHITMSERFDYFTGRHIEQAGDFNTWLEAMRRNGYEIIFEYKGDLVYFPNKWFWSILWPEDKKVEYGLSATKRQAILDILRTFGGSGKLENKTVVIDSADF